MNAITSIYHNADLKLVNEEGLLYSPADKFSAEDDASIIHWTQARYACTTGETKAYHGEHIKDIQLPSNPREAVAAVVGLMLGTNARMTDIAMENEDMCITEEHAYLHDFYYGLRSIDFGTEGLNMAFLRAID